MMPMIPQGWPLIVVVVVVSEVSPNIHIVLTHVGGKPLISAHVITLKSASEGTKGRLIGSQAHIELNCALHRTGRIIRGRTWA